MVVLNLFYVLFTAAGLAQSAERLTAEREVAGSILWAGAVLRVLKKNGEMKVLPLHRKRLDLARSSDDHVK